MKNLAHSASIDTCVEIAPSKPGIKHLAVTSAARSQMLPDVPTVAESLPGYEAITVAGFGAPRAASADIIGTLNAEINRGLADPQVSSRLESFGATVVGGTAAEFEALIARETERWKRIIRTAGIKPN